MTTRLAELHAEAFDLADAKALADEAVDIHIPHGHLPSSFTRPKSHLLDDLGGNERQRLARRSSVGVKMAVTFEPPGRTKDSTVRARARVGPGCIASTAMARSHEPPVEQARPTAARPSVSCQESCSRPSVTQARSSSDRAHGASSASARARTSSADAPDFSPA